MGHEYWASWVDQQRLPLCVGYYGVEAAHNTFFHPQPMSADFFQSTLVTSCLAAFRSQTCDQSMHVMKWASILSSLVSRFQGDESVLVS